MALANCLGGRFSPGIEVSYPVRDPNLYVKDWANGPGGAFRVNAAVLDYSKARADTPFLSVGYIPLRDRPLEPGDMTKFMAVPWHSDFNHCASHLRDPNPGNDQTLYWSWPAERPVAVYPQALARFDPATGWVPGRQLFAVRGAGTTTIYPAQCRALPEGVGLPRQLAQGGLRGAGEPDQPGRPPRRAGRPLPRSRLLLRE